MTRRDFFKGLGIAGMLAALPVSLTNFSSILKPKYDLVEGMPMKIYNIWPGVKSLVSTETANAVEASKIRQTIMVYNEKNDHGEVYKKARLVRFFGVTAASLDEGVSKLAEIIEDVNSKYHILGSLADSMAIKLVDGTFACVTYLDVEKWEDTINHEYSFLAEGGYPTPTARARVMNESFKSKNMMVADLSDGYFS